jgi:hypothetical protein
MSEGEVAICPGTEVERVHSRLVEQEAGRRCYDANESKGAAAAAVRCRCQRRRAASRRLLLLVGLGLVAAPLKKLGRAPADSPTASTHNERQVDGTGRKKTSTGIVGEGEGASVRNARGPVKGLLRSFP